MPGSLVGIRRRDGEPMMHGTTLVERQPCADGRSAKRMGEADPKTIDGGDPARYCRQKRRLSRSTGRSADDLEGRSGGVGSSGQGILGLLGQGIELAADQTTETVRDRPFLLPVGRCAPIAKSPAELE